jgi:transposase
MGHIHGGDRQQRGLVPARLEDSRDAANPVRLLAAFVDSLDVNALGFQHALPNQSGRPSDPPGDLRNLSLSGYFKKMRSRRQLEHASPRQLELRWLGRQRPPAFTTMAACRPESPQARKRGCRALTLLGKQVDLCGRECMAIEGSKGKAVQSTSRHVTEKKVPQLLPPLDETLATARKALAAPDTGEAHTPQPAAQGGPATIDP